MAKTSDANWLCLSLKLYNYVSSASVYSAACICFHMQIVMYMIAALHILLFNLQYFVYSFIDMDNNNQNKKS